MRGENAHSVPASGKMASWRERIEEAFEQNRQVYGSPRLHAQLQTQGIRCGRKRIVRLMHELDISARRPRHRVVTTRSDPGARVAPNLLQPDFTAQTVNCKWVTDVTSVATQQGWLYLAAVLDLFSRAIVGWSMAVVQDKQLVADGVRMALTHREPCTGLLHHSDRGSQYTSQEYPQLLAARGIQVSMIRKGKGSRQCCDGTFLGHPQGRMYLTVPLPDP